MIEKDRIIVRMHVNHESLKAGERYEVDAAEAAELVRTGKADFSTQEDITPKKAEKVVEVKPENKETDPKPKTEAAPEKPDRRK